MFTDTPLISLYCFAVHLLDCIPSIIFNINDYYQFAFPLFLRFPDRTGPFFSLQDLD